MAHFPLQKLTTRFLVATLLLACAWALSPGQNPPVVPPKPAGGTTLYDTLKLPADSVRTFPTLPKVGAWGLTIGKATPNPDGGVGILFDDPSEGLVYPTTELLTGPVGTIGFTLIMTTALDDGGAQRVLLDSAAAGGNARIFLALSGKKLSLAMTGDNGQTSSIDVNVNWGEKSTHTINIVWDANDLTLLIDGRPAGKSDKPNLAAREPLYLVIGNSRDFKTPAKMILSNLWLSTAREAQPAPGALRSEDNTPALEQTLKMAQGYQRRLYPALDRLKNQGVAEAPFAYAMAYSDIGDFDRAMQAVTPIANDAANPMNVQGVFLRADLLDSQKQYMDAFNVLQTLVNTSKDVGTIVRAQVKQAVVLYDQGDKSGAMKLIGDVISRYSNFKQLNLAYLIIAKDKINAGDFESAIRAAESIGTFGQLRQTVPIGKPLQLKVADADLNVRISDIGLPVTLTSTSGDKEVVTLRPAFSRGVYIGNVDTALGAPVANDGTLQVQGGDHITITYIDHLSPDGVDKPRTIGVDLATDADLDVLAQSAVDVYHEAVALQKKNVLDDAWVVVSDLPETVSEFFRDPETGEVLKKGVRVDLGAFMGTIKPGQAAYIELNEPDADTTPNPDTITVDISTKNTKKATITLTETGPHTGIFTALVKTALAADAKEGVFTVESTDAINVFYNDQKPSGESRSPLHQSRVVVTSGTLGKIVCGTTYVDGYGQTVFKNALRIGSNTPVVVKLEDRDLDTSDNKDTITIKIKPDSNDGAPLTLTETGPHTGVFTVTMKIATEDNAVAGPNLVKAKPGDRVAFIYADAENPSGKETPVSYILRMNVAEDASMKFFRQIVDKPKEPKLPVGVAPAVRPANLPPPKVTWEETTTLVPGFVYKAVLNDGDILPPTDASLMTAKILLKSQNGAWAEVILDGSVDQDTLSSVFSGQFFVRLGDKNSPSRAFVSQTGTVVDIKAEENAGQRAGDAWAMPALNVQGKDTVQAIYIEPLSAANVKDVQRKVDLRIGADAEITILNMQGNPIDLLKPGMPFEAQIADANGDLTPKRDTIKATLTSSCGDTLTLDFTETDIHSGIFSALVQSAYGMAGVANNILEVPFEGKVTITYQDAETIVGTPAQRTMDLATRPMAESECLLLTKVYDSPQFEVETLVRLGESLYAVGAAKLATVKPEPGKARTNVELQESERLLKRVIDRFPTSDFVVESLFLTGRIAKEEQNKADAEKLFQRVIKEYPDSELVPQALLQLVNLYVDNDDIDNAVETAMQLVNLYPKNTLVADAFVRIATYYYQKKKDYFTAGTIYQRVCERFPEMPNVDRIAYQSATAFYKAASKDKPEPYADAAKAYLAFAETYKDSELVDDALYWAANALKNLNNVKGAYKLLTRIVFEMPNTVDKYEDAVRLRNSIKELYPKIEEDD